VQETVVSSGDNNENYTKLERTDVDTSNEPHVYTQLQNIGTGTHADPPSNDYMDVIP